MEIYGKKNMMNLFKTKYRIRFNVRFDTRGNVESMYIPEYKLWWYPFWLKCFGCYNVNLEDAQESIEQHKKRITHINE